MTAEEIIAEALKLPRDAREDVVRQLLLNIDPGEENLSPEEWEKAWVTECERRLADLRSGKVKAVPGEEVFARAGAVRSS
jgi:putative addiction module component (TIGR02574 family)